MITCNHYNICENLRFLRAYKVEYEGFCMIGSVLIRITLMTRH